MIQCIGNAWLKPYIDTNTDLKKEKKNDFEFFFFFFLKLMNNAVLGETVANVKT